jgi:hypothetical protein
MSFRHASGGIRLIGFITHTAPAQAVPELTLDDGETVVALYLPMSYQIGGYALHLPECCLQRLEMPWKTPCAWC